MLKSASRSRSDVGRRPSPFGPAIGRERRRPPTTLIYLGRDGRGPPERSRRFWKRFLKLRALLDSFLSPPRDCPSSFRDPRSGDPESRRVFRSVFWIPGSGLRPAPE